MKTYNVFLNCLEQLLHRKLLIATLIITIVFLSLFTWALIEANNALDESPNVIQTDAPIGTDGCNHNRRPFRNCWFFPAS